MVVDDSLTSRKFVIQCVRSISKELKIVEADHGDQALQMLAENPDVDVIISDDVMPFLNGFELATKLKQSPSFAAIPVIILGSEGHARVIQKAENAGAARYLPRPASKDVIVETVLAICSQR